MTVIFAPHDMALRHFAMMFSLSSKHLKVMSCDRHYGIPNYPICSGNGVCMDGQCLCNAGWTSISDGELVDGIDCDINITVLKVLSIIYIVVSFPGLIEGLRTVSQLKQIYSTKTACLVACLVTNIGSYVYVSLKLVDPIKYTLGRSALLNFSLAVVITAVRCIESSYTMLMLKFLKAYYKLLRENQRKKLKKYSHIWNILMIACPIFSFVSLVVILFIATYRYKDKVEEETIAFACSNVAVVTVHIICRWNISSLFISELQLFLNESDRQSDNTHAFQRQLDNTTREIKELLKNALNIYNVVMLFLLNEWVVYFLDATWGFFRRKDTYQILILMITRSIVIPVYIKALQTTTQKHAKVLKISSTHTSSALLGMVRSAKIVPVTAAKPNLQSPNQNSQVRVDDEIFTIDQV